MATLHAIANHRRFTQSPVCKYHTVMTSFCQRKDQWLKRNLGVDKSRHRLKPTPTLLNPFKRVSDASRQFQLVASTPYDPLDPDKFFMREAPEFYV